MKTKEVAVLCKFNILSIDTFQRMNKFYLKKLDPAGQIRYLLNIMKTDALFSSFPEYLPDHIFSVMGNVRNLFDSIFDGIIIFFYNSCLYPENQKDFRI